MSVLNVFSHVRHHSRSYVNKNREITKRFVQHAEKRGIKALFITVDAPQLGRREKVRPQLSGIIL